MIIIFSKDRATQLDACLRSLTLHCGDHESFRKRVICKYSNARHEKQYETLRSEHPGAEFITESDFQADLEAALAGMSHVLFMVDDNLCIRPFRIGEIVETLDTERSAIGFSLRIGRNITRSYPNDDAPQRMPETTQPRPGVLCYRWVGAEYDFGYPLEVSSSLFRVSDVLPLIRGGERIHHPNDLEARIDAGKLRLQDTLPDSLCFEHSVAFCNPLNVVQTSYANRAGTEASLSVKSLLDRYDMGYRVDVEAFSQFTPGSCQEEVPFDFLPPRLNWDKVEASLQIAKTSGRETGKTHTFHCSIEPAKLSAEALQSTLGGLQLLDAAGSDPAVPWVEALGRNVRQQSELQTRESGKMIADLKQNMLRSNAWHSGQLVSLNKKIDEQTAALEAALGKLQRSRGRCLYGIEEESVLPGNILFLRGWVLLRETHSATRMRVSIRSFKGHRTFTSEIQFRPDMAVRFPGGRNVEKSGFLIHTPLTARCNSVALQYLNGEKWITFARRVVLASKIRPCAPPTIQEKWPRERPLVSVVIPCHNYGKFLGEAVDSVLAQTWQDLEVIVVNDGSTDPDTIRTLDNLNRPRTRVIHQQNLKLPAARNTGIEAARGKYICCLDADDNLAPTYIEKCLLRLEIDGYDVCGSWQWNFGTEDKILEPGRFTFKNLLRSNHMVNCAMFRRQLWESAGGFDISMTDGYEDWEFWIRLASLGARGTVIPEPLFLYRKHGRSMIDSTLEKHAKIVSKIRAKFRWRKAIRPAVGEIRDKWVNLLERLPGRTGKPRILLCLPYMTMGGAEKIISQICGKLRQRGFHFTIITTELKHASQGDSHAWFEPFASDIYHLPGLLEVKNWTDFITSLIRRHGVDMLWLVGSAYVYDLLPELKTQFPGLRVADILFNEVGHTVRNRKFDYLIDLNITETQSMKSWLLSHGESDDRVRVIPNGVDLSLFQPRGPEAVPFDTGGRRFVVGYFGRMSEEKGPDLFVDIAAQFKNDADLLFIMAGVGGMEPLVRKQIEEQGLGGSVKFLGLVPAHTHVPFCDVLVVPSRQDGRPNVVMEAMAMGVPVIASNVGGMAEMVSDNESGFLCEPGNIAQFAEKITLLSRDENLLNDLKARARTCAEQHFDINTAVSAFDGAFRGIMETRPASKQPLEAAIV